MHEPMKWTMTIAYNHYSRRNINTRKNQHYTVTNLSHWHRIDN